MTNYRNGGVFMKYGVRKPNLKKSIKARTTGKVKRQVKKAINPLYGKKGMGIVNDPKKAAYNAVYNRTTVGVSDIAKGLTAANGNPAASSSSNAPQKKEYSPNTYSVCGILMIVLGVFLALIGILLLFAVPVGGLIAVVVGVASVVIGRKYKKVAKERRANE
jgi:hypothetical protein